MNIYTAKQLADNRFWVGDYYAVPLSGHARYEDATVTSTVPRPPWDTLNNSDGPTVRLIALRHNGNGHPKLTKRYVTHKYPMRLEAIQWAKE